MLGPIGRLSALVVVLLSQACFRPSFDHPACSPNGECPSGLTCVASFCEAPTDGHPGVDAAVPGDASSLCYGTGIVKVCLAAAPMQPLNVSVPIVIDTGDPSVCASTSAMSGGNYCVVAASNITISAELRATGSKPLVLLSADSITANALIDVGSRRIGGVSLFGAGAGPAPTACGPGTPPTNGGGGAGGSFAGLGGNGGYGRDVPAGGGTPGAVATSFPELRAGCPGQPGQGGGTDGGEAGYGGGAVFLIAANRLDLIGGINAGGEGGEAGAKNAAGGGGGGAGGMIGLDAPMIAVTSSLVANGGGGGEGSSANDPGTNGLDARTLGAAAGGKDGTARSGDGGDGSTGAAGGPGRPGALAIDSGGGGGGGGGGAGVILAPADANLGTQISPAATRYQRS